MMNRKGYTLIELMVVLIVLALLSGLGVGGFFILKHFGVF